MISSNILEAIGNTPIVKLNKVTAGWGAIISAKLEYLNPGGSIKDRLGVWLIEVAEKKGLLKVGGTIVEVTSGNTGIGLAIAAAVKGYKCILVIPDKMSREKIRMLHAYGAKTIITPTAVAPEDARSCYSVAARIAAETPGAWYANQYNNLANRECHYRTTGPEILKQFSEVDILVAGIGTGGTICGIGKYLKEQKPSVRIVAVDPIGSIVYDYFKRGVMITPQVYGIEGIGEDFIPKNYDFSVIDDIVQVEDEESFIVARRLAKEEGIFAGTSSGAAVAGAIKYCNKYPEECRGKNILVIIPDSGDRYLTKLAV